MDIMQLLALEGFDFQKHKVKLIRHTREGGKDIEEIYKNGLLIDYQCVQSKDVLAGCDYVLSFIVTENTKAKFVGMFEITGKTTVGEIKRTRELPEVGIPDYYSGNQFYYFERESEFLYDYKDRLIIDWGKSAIQWCQNLCQKEVIEILPKGYVSEFLGFDDVILDFNDLKNIINNPDANREWHRMLASVAGVYLILDKISGKQYIGSAYGKNGILGRWQQYAKDGHGGNKLLMEVLDEEPQRHYQFQYSILRTLPKTLTDTEVITVETVYKKKLGSRAFGLNSN